MYAAVFGAAAIAVGYTSVVSATEAVTNVWLVSWLIFKKAYTREYWTNLNKPFGEMIRATPVPTGLDSVMNYGLLVLIVVRIALYFV